MSQKNLQNSNTKQRLLNINNYDIVLNDEENSDEVSLTRTQNTNNNTKNVFNKQSNVKRIQNFLFKPSI